MFIIWQGPLHVWVGVYEAGYEEDGDEDDGDHGDPHVGHQVAQP